MKKIVLVLLILVVIGGTAFAFDILSFPGPLRGGGSVMLDAGIGVMYTPWSFVSLVVGKVTIPPLFANVEYALPIGVPISVGAGVAFTQWNFFDYTLTQISPYTSANWHWGFDANWLDLYTGITVGYNIVSLKWKSDYYGTRYSAWGSNTFHWGTHVGAHFYFAKVFGVMIEAGYPFLIKTGLSFKFGGGGGSSSSSKSSSSQAKSTQKAKYMLVNSDSLNVRSGPSTDYEAVGRLTKNTRVEVLDSTGQWWKIKSGRIEGYVYSTYLVEE